MKLFMIAKNNIKKSIGTSMILFSLILLATILLYTGISVQSQLGSFIDEKNKELNGADLTLIVGQNMQNQVTALLEKRSEVSSYETHEAIYYTSPKIQNLTKMDKEKNLRSFILNGEDTYQIGKITIIEEANRRSSNGILVPYALKTTDGYRTGDQLQIQVDDKSYQFVIDGFYENIIFANSSNVSSYQFYVYGDQFHKLSSQVAEFSIMREINVDLKGEHESEEFAKIFAEEVKGDMTDKQEFFQILPYDTFKEGLTMFVSILMVILIAFSLILIVISLIVIRFAIIVHLEKNIKNIGSLGAIGYTTKQIQCALLLEFFMVAMAGIGCGLLLAILGSGMVGSIVSASIGLMWIGEISVVGIMGSILSILTLIVLVTAMVARRLNKVTVLVALRGGIETHSFRRNPIPLESTRWNIHLAIGIKGLLHNMKQNIVITIIVSMLTFASVYAVGMYYNFVVEDSALLDLVGMENSEVQMEVAEKDYDLIIAEIGQMEEVQGIIPYESQDMVVKSGEKESSVRFEITEDFSKLKVNTLVKGRLAVHDNEIVVSNRTMEELGLELGDSVTVSSYGTSAEYLIVGVKQHINGLGKGASLTVDGVKRLDSQYKINMCCIYLHENVDTTSFIKEINTRYSGVDKMIINLEDSIHTIMGSFNSSVTSICLLCGTITFLIVILILLLLIKVKILKEQSIMGLNKALGYTTPQLMLHILYGFLPIVILGSIVGMVIGAVVTNPFTAFLLSSNGIMKANFIIPYHYIVFVPLSIIVVATVTIALVSLRIRKITPNGLFDQ